MLILSLVVMSGCAPRLRFLSSVDAISGPKAESMKTYVLLPGIEGLASNDLQFLEYAEYVDRALADRGFMRTNSFEEASLAIFLVYGIGNPQTIQYSYSLPVWGQTGVTSSTSGRIDVFGNYQSTTTETPTYGLTGLGTATGTRTAHFRFMLLEALDLDMYRKSAEVEQVWKTEVVSSGSSDDLRLVFPYMVTAAVPYLGRNPGQKVRVVLPGDDPAVQAIRGLPD